MFSALTDAHDYVGAFLKLFDEEMEIEGIVLQVRVHANDKAAERVPEGFLKRSGLSASFRQSHELQVGVSCLKALDDGIAAISGYVVYQNYLEIVVECVDCPD
jgi:hypothetical protein